MKVRKPMADLKTQIIEIFFLKKKKLDLKTFFEQFSISYT